MGSPVEEEEKLAQMVHDFIESETTPPTCSPSSQASTFHHSTHLTLQGIVGSVTKAEMEVYDRVLVLLKYVKKMVNERKSSCVKRKLMMWLRIDGYDASLCKSSWNATFGRLGGDYDYIDIMMEDENGVSLRLIVDIDFKSQFELARPTSTYTQLFNTVPSVFVGSEEKLCKMISLLCSAAKESLKERGLHIPPWRKASYMQSKWLSCCQKISTIGFPIFKTEDSTQENVKNCDDDDDESSRTISWNPPKVEPKRRDLGDGSHGSCLSSQFSSLTVNYC
ncbi:hypothetical protein MRB53_000328 [Persea americana]|uniref:Uncharacterized protein n=1 Tax=Persea americana TaxID=3435 RepID=A0ACC2MNK4_PERAE|nr:hypothetical protein MRB53_000328 [Persea americana]